MPCLQQLLRGIKISQARSTNPASIQRPRLPITPTLLHNIQHCWSGHPLNQDRIMLWVAFTTCFMCSWKLCIHDSTKGFTDLTSMTWLWMTTRINVSSLFACRPQKQTHFARELLFYWTEQVMSYVCLIAALLVWYGKGGKYSTNLCGRGKRLVMVIAPRRFTRLEPLEATYLL